MITYISIVIIIGMIGFFENDFYIDFMIDGKYQILTNMKFGQMGETLITRFPSDTSENFRKLYFTSENH